MSTYSLDSLDKHTIVNSSVENEDCTRELCCDKLKAITSNSEDNIDESSWNAIIENGSNVTEEFSKSVEKLPVILGTRMHFRSGRPVVANKFNVPRRSLSSSSSTSLSEFRRCTTSLVRKRSDRVAGSMKADKKLGNVQPAIHDRSKKPVSYLELYRRRFDVDGRNCTCNPMGSCTSNIDKTNQQPAMNDENCVSSTVPWVEALHRSGSQIESQKSRETRSCEALDSFVTKDSESDENRKDFSIGSFSDVVQPINRQRRVSYVPYGIEDYKNLSVPSADRSLGPDRNEMEIKGEWLLRRRTYGDSVSALNRQRILRCADKLKHSRRNDFQKFAANNVSMDSKHPDLASKNNVTSGHDENIIPAISDCHPERQSNVKHGKSVGKHDKLSSVFREKKSEPVSSKRKTEAKVLSRGVNDLYEMSSDILDEQSILLKNLQQRHLEEKRVMDRLFKRRLCA